MPKGLKGFQKGNKICLGRKHTEETKRKIKESYRGVGMTGKKHSEKTKERIKKILRGRKRPPFSEETKRKMKKAKIKYWSNKEHRERLSEARKGKKLPEETKKKMREFWKGRPKPWIRGENNPRWIDGRSLEPYPIDWTETLKRAIRERDKYICAICHSYGNEIHHIDRNKKNCNPDNLITLCKKCHIKLHRKLSKKI